ncbi:hypothetical protein UlMin_010751 [Ulmus minor]
MNRKVPSKKKDEEAEVNELLKAVEGDMLLKLSINSHMSRVAPNYLESDLDRRLHSLKSRPSSSSPNPPPANSTIAPSPPQPQQSPDLDGDPELTAVIGEDLSARFAALKATLPPSGSVPVIPVRSGAIDGFDEDEDEEDEVEKLIRWAKDAARLDPSPPSDDDNEDEEKDSEPSDEEEDSDDEKGRPRKK